MMVVLRGRLTALFARQFPRRSNLALSNSIGYSVLGFLLVRSLYPFIFLFNLLLPIFALPPAPRACFAFFTMAVLY